MKRMSAWLGGLALGVLLGVAGAGATEEPSAHATASERTVNMGSSVLSPSDLELAAGETVAFQNHALYPLSVTFIEPAKGQAERIRCELVASKAGQKPRAPWGLFAWNSRGQLEGNIPPGRFASICSLAPGDYAYLVSRVGGYTPSGRTTASAQKGTIRVK